VAQSGQGRTSGIRRLGRLGSSAGGSASSPAWRIGRVELALPVRISIGSPRRRARADGTSMPAEFAAGVAEAVVACLRRAGPAIVIDTGASSEGNGVERDGREQRRQDLRGATAGCLFFHPRGSRHAAMAHAFWFRGTPLLVPSRLTPRASALLCGTVAPAEHPARWRRIDRSLLGGRARATSR